MMHCGCFLFGYSDYGTKVLPPQPSNTTWGSGSVVQVTWTIEANHAGGYSYRLCPKGEPLDEACFQKTPLRFVGMQGMRWGGGPEHGGTEIFFDGTYVTEGTMPAKSMWAQNPVPLIGGGDGLPGPTGQFQFPPKCTNTSMCSGMGDAAGGRLEIVDHVQIPEGLPQGDYVLGWRWDCEQSNQIWSSCSDVTIE